VKARREGGFVGIGKLSAVGFVGLCVRRKKKGSCREVVAKHVNGRVSSTSCIPVLLHGMNLPGT